MYDSTNEELRSMASSGESLPSSVIPISAVTGNTLKNLSDGLYTGNYDGIVYYVDSVNGLDTNAGTKAAPFKTVSHTLTVITGLFTNGIVNGKNMVIALKAGQSYSWNQDITLYGGSLIVTFYGDSNYGDYNSALVNGTTNPAVMSNLARPTITSVTSTVNGQNYVNGINCYGGQVILQGVSIQLPAAPSASAITNYGGYSDFVRLQGFSSYQSTSSAIILLGLVVNMTDITAYWGLLGTWARAKSTITSFSTQFQVNGTLLNSSSATTAQLNQRQYFMKFYPDAASNNTSIVYLSATSTNSTAGSGLLEVMWSDSISSTVTGSEVSLASFPINYSPGYGLSNYFFGLSLNSSGQYLNVINSRLMN